MLYGPRPIRGINRDIETRLKDIPSMDPFFIAALVSTVTLYVFWGSYHGFSLLFRHLS